MQPLLQGGPTIYEKFEALQDSGSASTVAFWEFVATGLFVLLVFVALVLLYRGLVARARRWADRDRRGQLDDRKRKNLAADEEHLAKGAVDFEDAEEGFGESALEFGQLGTDRALSVFWDIDGLRCGCSAKSTKSGKDGLTVTVESESVPLKGSLTVVIPEDTGHVSFFEAEIATAQGFERTLAAGATKLRMHRKHRAGVIFPGAAVRTRNGEEQGEPIVLRIHDLSLDGMGILAEDELETGDELTMRIQLPGYLDPFSAQAEVVWVQKDLADMFRAGAAIALEEIALRALIADFIRRKEEE